MRSIIVLLSIAAIVAACERPPPTAAEKQRDATYQACKVEAAGIAAASGVGAKGDKFCIDTLRELIEGEALATCMKREGLNAEMAIVFACGDMKTLKKYCPPAYWPNNMNDPATRATCRL